jgi:predicted alpha/beta-hydrolase family hydrolase
MTGEPVTLSLGEGQQVSGLWLRPNGAKAALVLAHGAGVSMTHKSMAGIAEGLARRKIATLRYNFLYMERKSGRPDAPPLAHKAVRAAVAEGGRRAGKLPLFAGGRSFGGRMTSQAQALEPLAKVRGLVFFAYPLHPAGKPGVERAEHLRDVNVPMLFLQGSRDPLAELVLLEKTVRALKARATLKLVQDADHSFHVPVKTGRKDAEVMDEILDTARDWMTDKA